VIYEIADPPILAVFKKGRLQYSAKENLLA
jgi:hypothetical protein